MKTTKREGQTKLQTLKARHKYLMATKQYTAAVILGRKIVNLSKIN